MTAILLVRPVYLLALAAPLSVWAGNILTGVVLAWALARAVGPGRRALTLPPRPVLLALAAYLLAHVLATAFAPGPSRWDKLVEEMWFKLLLVAIPVVTAGRGEVARRAIWLTLAAGTAAAIYGIFQHLTDSDPIRGHLLHFNGAVIAQGFTNHHLSFGGQLVTLMALAMCWLRRDVLAIFDQTFAVTSLLQVMSLLIAVAGITLTLLVLARERIAEVALYRALGASRLQVFRVFLGKGVGMAVCGQVLGAAGGAALAIILVYLINRAYFGWTILLTWPARDLAGQAVLLLAAAVAASIYPAARATGTPASELNREDL